MRSADNADGYREAFHLNLHAAGPRMRGLGGLGGTGTFTGYPTVRYAQGGNNPAMIVGFAYNPSNEHVAFLWTRANGMLDLNTLVSNLPDGVVFSGACGINAYSYVLGFTADGRPFLLVGQP